MMAIPSLSNILPNCVTGSSPRSYSRCVGARLSTFFQSTYNACGTPSFFDPVPQRVDGRPDRLFLAQPQLLLADRIVSHVHQAAARTTLLQPVVKTSVYPPQLPKMPPSLSPLSMRFPLAPPAPQPFRQHPSPERLRSDPHPVFTAQKLGRQRRPNSHCLPSPILFTHQLQHPPTKLRRLSPRAGTPLFAMPQAFGPFRPIRLPQPLHLPVTHPNQTRGIHHLRLLALHSRKYFYPHSSRWLIPILPIRPPSEAVH
jgi:hypothetical protein